MISSEFELREANLSDIPQLLELEQSIIEAERPYNPDIKKENAKYYDIENLVHSENACLLVVEANGNIIGTGYAHIRASKEPLVYDVHSYLGFMYVDPTYRGRGVNQLVIESLIKWSKDRSVSHFSLDVYSENTAAIKAYEKVGFKPSSLEMTLNLDNSYA